MSSLLYLWPCQATPSIATSQRRLVCAKYRNLVPVPLLEDQLLGTEQHPWWCFYYLQQLHEVWKKLTETVEGCNCYFSPSEDSWGLVLRPLNLAIIPAGVLAETVDLAGSALVGSCPFHVEEGGLQLGKSRASSLRPELTLRTAALH